MARTAGTGRRISLAVVAASCAAALFAGLAPASPARAATPNPHNPKFTGNGVARMAAEAAIRGTTSGTVTGVVRGDNRSAGSRCLHHGNRIRRQQDGNQSSQWRVRATQSAAGKIRPSGCRLRR